MKTPWWIYPLVWGACLLFVAPMILMVSGSLKTNEEISRDPFALLPGDSADPGQWAWGNYAQVFESMPLTAYLRNTVLLCLGCVAGSLLSCSLVAYGISRVPWRGGPWVFATVMLTLLLPWQITMIPRFVLISGLGLYDTLWAIILPAFLGDAFFIFLLRQFFLTIPQSLLDAGRLDGLGHWGLFSWIVVPLSRPALMAVALFQFVETWNNFGGPLLYLSDPQKFPVAYGLERFVSSYGDQTALFLAAAVVITAPAVLVFFLTQRFFVAGVATSGIKG